MTLTGRSKAVSAAFVSSVALLTAACGTSAKNTQDTAATGSPTTASSPAASTSPSASASPAKAALTFSSKTPTISNGTDVVVINHQPVTFPGPVTDAVWSPNGARLAYVDGDGNVAVAHPDGTGVRVLTQTVTGVKRARPTWSADGRVVYFAERKAGGRWSLKGIGVNPAPSTTGSTSEESAWFWDPYGPGTFTEPAANADDPVLSLDADRKVAVADGPGSKPYPALRYAAQVGSGANAKIWIGDANGRSGNTALFGPGTEPAISSDGSRVAFVGANGQIFAAGTGDNKGTVQISFGVNHPSNLAWSPDGSRIAFSTANDVESIAATVPAGATSNPTTQESPTAGVPAYQRDSDPVQLVQFSGADLVDASVAISKAANPTLKTAADWNPFNYGFGNGAVIVATGSDVEAEAAAALPGQLLFTRPGGLDPRVSDELNRMFGPCLKPPADTSCAMNHVTVPVTIVGTASEIPLSVDSDLKALGYKVTRVDATDPYKITLSGAATPASVSVIADDDAQSQLQQRVSNGTGNVEVITHGASMPDGVKTFLNALPKGVKVTTYGAEAATAFASAWTGKPSSLRATPASPQTAVPTAFVASQSPIWQAALALHDNVAMADPSSLPASLATSLDAHATEIASFDVIGDAAPWQTTLGSALGTPFTPAIGSQP